MYPVYSNFICKYLRGLRCSHVLFFQLTTFVFVVNGIPVWISRLELSTGVAAKMVETAMALAAAVAEVEVEAAETGMAFPRRSEAVMITFRAVIRTLKTGWSTWTSAVSVRTSAVVASALTRKKGTAASASRDTNRARPKCVKASY